MLTLWHSRSRASRLEASSGVSAYAISVRDPNVLYASGQLGLFRTADGGTSWTMVAPVGSVAGVSQIVISPESSDHLYLNSGAVLESVDGGHSWHQLASLSGVTCLALDSASQLHAGTGNAGTFDLIPDPPARGNG